MPKIISEKTKNNIIQMYNNKYYTLQEIASLNNVTTVYIIKLINEKELEKRNKKGRSYVYQKKGYPNRKKFTEEQENKIAKDYYENGLSNSDLKVKYGINRVQMQRIRDRFKAIYGFKKHTPKKFIEKKEKSNENQEI